MTTLLTAGPDIGSNFYVGWNKAEYDRAKGRWLIEMGFCETHDIIRGDNKDRKYKQISNLIGWKWIYERI